MSNFFFVGIAGSGMSAIAQILKLQGHNVTGSDRNLAEIQNSKAKVRNMKYEVRNSQTHHLVNSSIHSTLNSTSPVSPYPDIISNNSKSSNQTNINSQSSNPVLENFEKLGIELFPQDGSGITSNTDFLVVSTAIEETNPDIIKAQNLGITIKKRSDILSELANEKFTICVGGTSGKSTVTGMVYWILETAGFSPTVINGGIIKNIECNKVEQASCLFETQKQIDFLTQEYGNAEKTIRPHDLALTGNAKLGNSEYLVIETDESDGSITKYYPQISIITNISKDHKTIEELRNLFITFAEHTNKILILNADCKEIQKLNLAQMIKIRHEVESMKYEVGGQSTEHRVQSTDSVSSGQWSVVSGQFSHHSSLITHHSVSSEQWVAPSTKHQTPTSKTGTTVLTFGIENTADFMAKDISLFPFHSTFSVNNYSYQLNLPGIFNISNALAAITLAKSLGIENPVIKQALKTFKGIKRRFEVVGEINNIKVLDDFAHNPSKIAATLEAILLQTAECGVRSVECKEQKAESREQKKRKYEVGSTKYEMPEANRTSYLMPHTSKPYSMPYALCPMHKGKLIVVFQPHGFGPTKFMKDELIEIFTSKLRTQDWLFMPEIYYAGGTADKSISSEDLIREIKKQNKNAVYIPIRKDIISHIVKIVQPYDCIIVMGARDDTLPEFCISILKAIDESDEVMK